MKHIKGWTYLVSEDDGKYWLAPWGNGTNQWQYPIFPSRKEARAWRNAHDVSYVKPRLKKVNISVL